MSYIKTVVYSSILLCPQKQTCFYLLHWQNWHPIGSQSIWHCGLAFTPREKESCASPAPFCWSYSLLFIKNLYFSNWLPQLEPFQHNTALRCHLDWAGDSDRSVSLLIHSLFCILKSSTEGAVTVCEKRLLRSDYSLSFHDFHTQVKSVFSPL